MSKLFEKVSDLLQFAKTHENSVVLEGMIKVGDGPNHVMYSATGCNEWIPISTDMISSAEYLYERECRKLGEDHHTHPYVRLTVNAGAENGAYLRALSSLLTPSRPGTEAASRRTNHVASRDGVAYAGRAARVHKSGDLFGRLMRKRGITPLYNVDACEYDTDICPGLGCVCVDYEAQHAWCCDCCVG